MAIEKRNRAFLSYSRSDNRIADWLHASLDRYRTPRALIGLEGDFGPVPGELHPIFRDRTDLSGGGSLDARIETALRHSDALVVLCTPNAAKSKWVNREVEVFLEQQPLGKVFPVIADGEPDSENPETECFPPALKGKGVLAADVRQRRLKDGRIIGDGRDLGRLKLVAGLLGLPLDMLIQRERRRQNRMLALSASASVIFFLVAATAVWFGNIASERADALLEARDAVLLRESALVAEKASSLAKAGHAGQAARALLSVLPTNDSPASRPVSPEAVAVLASISTLQESSLNLTRPDSWKSDILFGASQTSALVSSAIESGANVSEIVNLVDGSRIPIHYAFRSSPSGAIFLDFDGSRGVAVFGGGDDEGVPVFLQNQSGFAELSGYLANVDAGATVAHDGPGAAIIRQYSEFWLLSKSDGTIRRLAFRQEELLAAHAETGQLLLRAEGGVMLVGGNGEERSISFDDATAAAFSPSGNKVSLASSSGFLIAESDAITRVFNHAGQSDYRCAEPTEVVFASETELVLLSGSSACRFSTSDGSLMNLTTLQGPANALSPDGEWAISGGRLFRTRTVMLPDVYATGLDYAHLPDCTGQIAAGSPLEFTHCRDNEAIAEGNRVAIAEIAVDRILEGVISPSGQYIAAAAGEGYVVIDLVAMFVACKTPSEIRFIFDDGPYVLFGDGQKFGFGLCQPDVALASDLQFDQGASRQSGVRGGPTFAALSLDELRLLTSGAEESAKIWDLGTARLIWEQADLPGPVSGFTDGGNFLRFAGRRELQLAHFPPTLQLLTEQSSYAPPPRYHDAITPSPPSLFRPPRRDVPTAQCAETREFFITRREVGDRTLPPHSVVQVVITCSGLTEAIENVFGGDVLEGDLLVMRAESFGIEELTQRYSWLTQEQISRLRYAVGASDEVP